MPTATPIVLGDVDGRSFLRDPSYLATVCSRPRTHLVPFFSGLICNSDMLMALCASESDSERHLVRLHDNPPADRFVSVIRCLFDLP